MVTSVTKRIGIIFGVSALIVSFWIFQGICCKQQAQSQLKTALFTLNDPIDVIPMAVIGSGPSGLSAALYGARLGIHTVVFEGYEPGGQLTKTTLVENIPGSPVQMGVDYMNAHRQKAESFGAFMCPQELVDIDVDQWPFKLKSSDGNEFYALTVIIATGAAPRTLDIPGEQEYWGKGVSSCAICDAPFFKGENVVIVGGGDSAAEMAMQLAPYVNQVTILVRKDYMRASVHMQKRLTEYENISIEYNVEVKEVIGDGAQMTGLTLYNNKKKIRTYRKVTGLFLAVGHIPNTEIFKNKLQMDKSGYLLTKGNSFDLQADILKSQSITANHGFSQATSVPGIFAAGDVEDSVYRQVAVAEGHGVCAAIDAEAYLRQTGYSTKVAKQIKSRLFEP